MKRKKETDRQNFFVKLEFDWKFDRGNDFETCKGSKKGSGRKKVLEHFSSRSSVTRWLDNITIFGHLQQ